MVPYLEDNYGYIVIDDISGSVVLVDPADPTTFDEYFETYNITKIDAILTTHKHWDHAGGNSSLIDKFPDVRVYGGRDDAVDGWTNLLDDNDTIGFGDYNIDVITTPCHTVGHVVYVIRNIGSKNETIAFTGDFLFMASWGMFFEGTAAQMQRWFDKFLELCPANTKLFYGHE